MSSRWDDYFMDVAVRTAELSYAKRTKVGSIAVKERRIILCGYNGTPPGDDNSCEELVDGELVTKPAVLHAEENLIIFSSKYGISLNGAEMYSTHDPCLVCSRLIFGSGIRRVAYRYTYRDLSGIDFLKSRNVLIERI